MEDIESMYPKVVKIMGGAYQAVAMQNLVVAGVLSESQIGERVNQNKGGVNTRSFIKEMVDRKLVQKFGSLYRPTERLKKIVEDGNLPKSAMEVPRRETKASKRWKPSKTDGKMNYPWADGSEAKGRTEGSGYDKGERSVCSRSSDLSVYGVRGLKEILKESGDKNMEIDGTMFNRTGIPGCTGRCAYALYSKGILRRVSGKNGIKNYKISTSLAKYGLNDILELSYMQIVGTCSRIGGGN